ncbi:hypothetical protein AB0I84_05965 [Streptomyces spectabilis]
MIYFPLAVGLITGAIAFSHHKDRRIRTATRWATLVILVLALLQWGAW